MREEDPKRQRQKIPGRVQPSLMANTFNEGIRLKEAFQSEISAIRISRPVTNFELFAQESSVRNNDVGGGEEAAAEVEGQQSSTCQTEAARSA